GGVVRDGLRVGHRGPRGVAADRRRAGPRRDGLLVLVPRLPQVRVQIDEAGRDDEPSGVDPLGAFGSLRARDEAASDGDVPDVVDAGGRVEDPPALEHEARTHAASPFAPPSSRNSSAILTAMPFVTCSSITERGRSATSESISTPRFIGPGCMIRPPSGMRATRSRVMPNKRAYSRTLGKYSSRWRSRWTRRT